jgi:hypothetical protein
MGSTQPSIQLVPAAISARVKLPEPEADQSLPYVSLIWLRGVKGEQM